MTCAGPVVVVPVPPEPAVLVPPEPGKLVTTPPEPAEDWGATEAVGVLVPMGKAEVSVFAAA